MSRQLLQLLFFISLLASTFTFEVTFSELLLVIDHALLTIISLGVIGLDTHTLFTNTTFLMFPVRKVR